MVAPQHKSLPHKASFLPLTVGQKSHFSPLASLLLSPLSPHSHPPLLPSSSIHLSLPFSSSLLPLLSSILLSLLCSSLLSSTPYLPPRPPGPAGLCGANHQTAAPLSPLTEQLPPPQQYTTLLGQSSARATTIQDPHLANRGGGLGRGGPSGLMEGTRRVNY